MVLRHAVDCDLCGTKDINPTEFGFVIGRSMDAAGSSEDDTVGFDVCPECLPKVCLAMIRVIQGPTTRNYEANDRITAEFKKLVKKK